MEKVYTEKAPAAIGPYSQAMKAGGLLFTSGQIPIDPATGAVAGEDITAQTIPEDFARNQKVHHCYIVRRLPIEDAMAEVGFSAEEIAERVKELRNPEARKPRAAVPAHAQAGNGKSNFAGKLSPAGKPKKKKFYASKPKGK